MGVNTAFALTWLLPRRVGDTILERATRSYVRRVLERS